MGCKQCWCFEADNVKQEPFAVSLLTPSNLCWLMIIITLTGTFYLLLVYFYSKGDDRPKLWSSEVYFSECERAQRKNRVSHHLFLFNRYANAEFSFFLRLAPAAVTQIWRTLSGVTPRRSNVGLITQWGGGTILQNKFNHNTFETFEVGECSKAKIMIYLLLQPSDGLK